MPTVPASEFIRNFGTYQRLVAREPVAVTAHGRIAGVYVSPEDAALLERIRGTRKAFSISEVPDDIMEAIRNTVPDPETAALNHLMDEE